MSKIKYITLFFALFLASCSSTTKAPVDRSISSVKPFILILGDSNLVGSFGDALHGSVAGWKDADVMSIAIGGGNASYYNRAMKNLCCGYKVRLSKKGSSEVKVVSASNKKNSALIAPEYNGNLVALLNDKKPTMVVIALGSNADSLPNHKTLLAKINNYNPNIPVFWVGPPSDPKISANKSDIKIESAINSYPRSPYHFFSSQKVAKHLHPGPAEAQKWVKGFIEELSRIPRD